MDEPSGSGPAGIPDWWHAPQRPGWGKVIACMAILFATGVILELLRQFLPSWGWAVGMGITWAVAEMSLGLGKEDFGDRGLIVVALMFSCLPVSAFVGKAIQGSLTEEDRLGMVVLTCALWSTTPAVAGRGWRVGVPIGAVVYPICALGWLSIVLVGTGQGELVWLLVRHPIEMATRLLPALVNCATLGMVYGWMMGEYRPRATFGDHAAERCSA